MPDDEIKIRTDHGVLTGRSSARRRGPRSTRQWFILGSLIAAAIALLALVILTQTNPAPPRTGRLSEQSAPETAPQPTPPDASPQGDEPPPVELVVDDPAGELLWASPTAGPPISLAYAPAGAQCLVHLRPATIAGHAESEKVLAALGPWGESTIDRLRELTASELDELDRLLVTIIAQPDGGLNSCLRAELVEPWDQAELVRRFPDSREAQHAGQAYRIVGDRACFLAPGADGAADRATLVVCPAELAPDLIDAAGEPPPLVRDIESLVAHSDADLAATAIVAPQFFQASGADLLVDDAAPLRDALRWFADRDATAFAASLHWDENFFLQVRAVPALNVSPRRLAAKLRERIEQAPDMIEELVLAAPWHPHGRKVLARFPGMLRKVAGYARAAEDDRHGLIRCYLPAVAGHNLLMAAELLLTQPRGELADASPAAPDAPATIDQRLAQPTTLAFAKETLERAIELLAEDTGLDIAIAGADLQLEGITKNQSFGLELRDQPAGDVLLEILLRCNPDRTAEGPADPRQKLVYVVEPPTGDAPGRIIVTTRTAAQKRDHPLPDVFVVGPS